MEFTNREQTDFAIRQANDIIDEGFDPNITLFCINSKNLRKSLRGT